MRPRRVLVTGASGFLGCRLVERLVLAERIPVRAVAHRPGRAARLARLPVEIAWADVTDPASLESALDGCDVVVHCAYGTSKDRLANHRVTVEGTRLLAEAALAHGVRRLVHISTVAVYSYSPPTAVDERSPFVRSGDAYCDDKIEAEEVIWRLVRRRGLPATVLRLGNVWGPFSAPWTVRPLAHIRDGWVALLDEGSHASNALFVDNAVEAILRAIQADGALGEAFFITDDELSWREWYGRYASWLGGRPLHSIGSRELDALANPPLSQRMRTLGQDARANVFLPVAKYVWRQVKESRALGPAAAALRERVPVEVQSRLRVETTPENPRRLPSLGLLQVYRGRAVFSSGKAKRQIGYGPLVQFDQAADITEQWARWARLV